jgi:hypothetical protein
VPPRSTAAAKDRGGGRAMPRATTFARFSANAAGLSAATGRGVDAAAGGYEGDRHGEAQAGSAQELSDAFIDRFAVAAAPEPGTGRGGMTFAMRQVYPAVPKVRVI